MSVELVIPPSKPLATSKHTVSSDTVIPDGQAAYVPTYVKIATGVRLKIGTDSDLEIG